MSYFHWITNQNCSKILINLWPITSLTQPAQTLQNCSLKIKLHVRYSNDVTCKLFDYLKLNLQLAIEMLFCSSGVYPPLSDGSNSPRIREIASAEGAKLPLPKARSPFRLGSLRERRKLPPRGLGRSPRHRSDFEHFLPNGVHFGLLLISYFLKNQIEKIAPKPRTMKEV